MYAQWEQVFSVNSIYLIEQKGESFDSVGVQRKGKMKESWGIREDILKKVELGLCVKDAFGQACMMYKERQILCTGAM